MEIICAQGHVLDAGATVCSRCGWTIPVTEIVNPVIEEVATIDNVEIVEEAILETPIKKVVKKVRKKK